MKLDDIDLDGFGVAVIGMTGVDAPKAQSSVKPKFNGPSKAETTELAAGIERGSDMGFGVPCYVPEGSEI